MAKSLASLKVLCYRKISTVAFGCAEFLLRVSKMNSFLDPETAYLKQTLTLTLANDQFDLQVFNTFITNLCIKLIIG